MNDVLFIQFVNDIKMSDGVYTGVGNGFSDTYDLCKSKGDFLWVNLPKVNHVALYNKIETLEYCQTVELPISKGVVYISAICITHLYQTNIWAKRYPDIKFIVGGPAVCSDALVINEILPSNFIITDQSVEELFGVENFSYTWKLDLPPDDNVGYFYPYTLNTECYWKKCTYCSGYNSFKARRRTKINFEFKDLDFSKRHRVRLHSPSLDSKFIINQFSKLPRIENLDYMNLMRPSKYENEALKKVAPENRDLKMLFGMGIEFPSNKKLNSVNRGITVEETLETLHTIADNYKHSEIVMTSILGWNDLIESDLKEAEIFINNLPSNSRLIIARLLARPKTDIHRDYTVGRELNIGTFYRGFVPKLTDDQNQINDEARVIFNKHTIVQDFYDV